MSKMNRPTVQAIEAAIAARQAGHWIHAARDHIATAGIARRAGMRSSAAIELRLAAYARRQAAALKGA